MQDVVLNVNGLDYELKVRSTRSLADVLREDIGLIGTKLFCNEGECGACTVIVDGIAVNSCIFPVFEVEGRSVTTIEGIAEKDGTLHSLQTAFLKNNGVQCGFCTSGMIMSAKSLLDQNPDPTEDEIRTGISGNLCRCTGYVQIVESIIKAAEMIK